MCFRGVSLSEFVLNGVGLIFDFIEGSHVYGGLVLIGVLILRPFTFLPAMFIAPFSGFLFGPFWGSVYTLIGENLAANVAFLVSRFFRREGGYELSWVREVDLKVRENGFIATLFLRLVWTPYEVVSYGMGFTSISHRDFALASVLGIAPSLLFFVFLGSSFQRGNDVLGWVVLLGFAVGCLLLTFVGVRLLSSRYSRLG